MAIGIYVHIPYCVQKCHYCSFATFQLGQVVQPEDYITTVCKEIQTRAIFVPQDKLVSVYFGGGTPSLLTPNQINQILQTLRRAGFPLDKEIEITIEINPGTLTDESLKGFLDIGVNRLSVGVQTFSDKHLKACGRLHSADDSRRTLSLLTKWQVNFSMDLLYALPFQTMTELEQDLDEFIAFNPPHVSPYCLTLPEGHQMQENRPSDERQAAMFERVREKLNGAGLKQYEISNFAQVGYHSRHNSLYWNDQNYWGVGLSSHSYFKEPDLGVRFWNPRNMNAYLQQIEAFQGHSSFLGQLPKEQIEYLKPHEALTDLCHTGLRQVQGLDLNVLRQKYSAEVLSLVEARLSSLESRLWLENDNQRWSLTPLGQLMSDQAFLELTFGADELDR